MVPPYLRRLRLTRRPRAPRRTPPARWPSPATSRAISATAVPPARPTNAKPARETGRVKPANAAAAVTPMAPTSAGKPRLPLPRNPPTARPSSGQTPITSTSAANCGPVTRSNQAGPAANRRPARASVSVGNKLPTRTEPAMLSRRTMVRMNMPSRESNLSVMRGAASMDRRLIMRTRDPPSARTIAARK